VITRTNDGKLDGAPFEYYGRTLVDGVEVYDQSEDIQIHHNRVEQCLNFIETYGNATDMVIAYNFYQDGPCWPLLFHYDDCEHPTWTHEPTYQNVQIIHNTFVARFDPDPSGWGMVGLMYDTDHLPDPAKNSMTVRNNVFVTHHTILSWFNPLGASLVHDHNLFHFVGNGRLSVNQGVWVQAPSEIIADARFVNLEGADYRLKADSPARDAGASSLFSVDLDGIAVPTGAAPDMGAWEFH
jgi:hypothetical protein